MKKLPEWSDLKRHFSKNDIQIANKHTKGTRYNLSVEKCNPKPQYHLTSIKMATTTKKQNHKCW